MIRGRGRFYQPRNYNYQNQQEIENEQQQQYSMMKTDVERKRTQTGRGNSRGRSSQRNFYERKDFKQNNYYKKQFNENKQNNNNNNINKDEVEKQKQEIKEQLLKIDQVLKEESIFSIQHKENQRVKHENERVIATDNYSTLALTLAAIQEYKAIVDAVPAKERVFCEAWSCTDHCFMRNQQLQMYLATQDEIQGLINDEPAIYNIYNENGISQVEDVRNELQQLKATKEMIKVFANYLPTQDRNKNTQVFLPYRYRSQNGNVIGLRGNNEVYDIVNNQGMVDATSYIKDAETQQWRHFALNQNERTRRYDPMAIQQFIYQQTRANQQLQGGIPAPGNISFQQSEFDSNAFNNLFGCYILNYSYNKQKTNHTQNRFIDQRLRHGVFYYDRVMKFKDVIEKFPEIKSKLYELSFNKEEIGIIRREPMKPIIWTQNQQGNEEATFVIQGSSTLHVMSPFVFWNQQDAQAWGGYYLRIGQQTYGYGDINLYITENVGSYKYQIKTRTSFVNGLECIFKKIPDRVFSTTLAAEM